MIKNAGHVARMEQIRNAYTILFRKHGEKRPLIRPSSRFDLFMACLTTLSVAQTIQRRWLLKNEL
jgi:hypothetical protein